MNALADAIILAVTHISCRDDEDDVKYLDEDVNVLEGVEACLRDCTPVEEDSLANAAERVAAAERARKRPNQKWLHDYEHWMEEMFVES